ncbi:MAG: hypothetical protein HYY65_04035 [Candidatus Tectomicrobia bacterium]|uniref:Ketopantoate reductase C-terminal domain-containing protein n=1 Tax=Tectimicrobiota bacterium TaxID=2528274 RepID=A0A932GNT0_UNCTE|nr:hypothetical protein [Candidatus Tectomicrobia bacterium]
MRRPTKRIRFYPACNGWPLTCGRPRTTRVSPGGLPACQPPDRGGRRLESEALQGTVIRLGERHHIPTPIHRAAYASLLVQERRYRSPSPIPGPWQ